jgi:hypothetical protein
MMEDMIRRIAPLALFTLAAAAIVAPTIEANAPREPVEVKTVLSAGFSPGTVVRIAGTAGQLNIEAWDQPRVEATLTRTEFADADDRDRVKRRLERIGLTVEKRGNDIAVELKTPKRNFLARWLRGKTNAALVCRVMVPRNAKLVVRHQNGGVFVYGTAADIDARARFGDIVLQLADPSQYAIDARVKVGGVYTDYSGRYRHPVPVGEKFASATTAGGHVVRLRVGIGGISVVKMGPVPTSGF